MSAAQILIDAEADDLVVIARAMCRSERHIGAAPCTCGEDMTRCAAIDVYGHQAREVVAVLAERGRLARPTPDPIAQDLAAYGGFRMGADA